MAETNLAIFYVMPDALLPLLLSVAELAATNLDDLLTNFSKQARSVNVYL